MHTTTDLPAVQQQPAPALFNRPDTILGICQGVADDLGISPLWLRVPFGAAFYWNMAGVSAAYLVLGLIVVLARWLVPVTTPAAAPAATGEAAPIDEPEQLQLAA
jgi:phage shock protein PspC (stress-responsive transcriptional regulator)